jgi:Protein of unknown function (DUF3499)
MRCGRAPAATVFLLHEERAVVIADLTAERDDAGLDVCDEHVGRMTPPLGWSLRDRREAARAAV